jgi:hypothetical protein
MKTGGLLALVASLRLSSSSDKWRGVIALAPTVKLEESYNPVKYAIGRYYNIMLTV